MSADVLFTNGDDYSFTDTWVDADDSRELIQQQITIGVRMAQGDWFLNKRAGVDHIRFLTSKRVNVQAYAVSCALHGIERENPYVDIINATGKHEGRTVTVAMDGVFLDQPFRLVAQSPTSATPTYGDNAHIAAFSYIFFTG